MSQSLSNRARPDSDGTLIDGRGRAVIEALEPQIDGGRFACKRIIGDVVNVSCDIFTDGHDLLSAVILFRQTGAEVWQETPLSPLPNDAWQGEFVVDALGLYEFTVLAWVDHFRTWCHDLKRRDDEADIAVHLIDGAAMIREAAARAGGEHERKLNAWADDLALETASVAARRDRALDTSLGALALRFSGREFAVQYDTPLSVRVDDERAGFSAWYEFFPRSTVIRGPRGGHHDAPLEQLPHGTFRDAIDRLPYIADLGFNVVYLPPVHPIGRKNRKGRNNQLTATDDDVGVCWAIGAREGGHTSLLPALGTLEDFNALTATAREQGMELAMDIAFQCAPDHPWVRDHPQWFKWRADGTVQFAENPPKKYQDIYPLNFESDDWQNLWAALRDVFRYWIAQGVRIFRVDNPHTKSFGFWQWVIAEVKQEQPDAIFLAEAFTRPKVMHRLAKVGFTHSYTYFTWRNSREELEDYLLELSQGPGVEYFRPNFWPNTPDILHETLQHGGRAAAALRLVLAATMSSNYGIYGPVFELAYAVPREPGSEEYLDSEKYQLRQWYLDAPDSLAPLIRRVNAVRAAQPALQQTREVAVHSVDNRQLICFSKRVVVSAAGDGTALSAQQASGQPTESAHNTILVIVNLDPHNHQSGWTRLDMQELGLDSGAAFEVHDLLSGDTYYWSGSHNYIALDPAHTPAHILLLPAAANALNEAHS